MTTLALHRDVIHEMGKSAVVSDRPIRLIPILAKFRPGHLVSLGIDNGVMSRTLLA
jgi:hypothetical protein